MFTWFFLILDTILWAGLLFSIWLGALFAGENTFGMMLGRLWSFKMATPRDLPGRFLMVWPAVLPRGWRLFWIIWRGAPLLLNDPEFPFAYLGICPSLMTPSLTKTLLSLSIRDDSNFYRLFWVKSFWDMKISNWLRIIFIMADSFRLL